MRAVLRGDGASEPIVASTLRSLPQLDDAGRGRVARRVFGVGVLRARLAWMAGPGADGDAAALLAAYVEHEEEGAPYPRAVGDDDVDGTGSGDRPWPQGDVHERISVERSCPRWLVDELARSLGDEGADAFLAASNTPGPKTLRTNTLKTTRARLQRALAAEGIAVVDNAACRLALDVVDGEKRKTANLFGSEAWKSGLFEVQDASSQLCALACRAQPGDVVVDLCAGRGGKTLALAASMADRGVVWADDVDERALRDLLARARRAGATCVRLGRPAPRSADVVLVDAPCSSLGPLRRSPDLRWTLDRAALDAFPAQQRALLDDAFALAKPGGRVVYATCTVRREENDDVVRGRAVQERRLLLPHVDGCDGFFWATLRA